MSVRFTLLGTATYQSIKNASLPGALGGGAGF